MADNQTSANLASTEPQAALSPINTIHTKSPFLIDLPIEERRFMPAMGKLKSHRPKIICITTVDLSLRFLIFDFLQYLRAKGYDVTGICAPGEHVAEVEQALASVFTVPMTRRITPLRDLQSLIRLIRVLSQERPDIVHTHTPKANLLGQLAARLTNVPVRVSTVHGLSFTRHTSLFKRLFLQTIETISARFAHLVFLINQEDVETALALRVCRPEQVRLLKGGMGIDLTAFNSEQVKAEASQRKRRALGLPHDAIVVGFVGRLVREKGLLELFDACGRTRVEFPTLWLLIVGPHDIAKPDAVLPEIAQRYGIADQCVFTGLRTDTADLYGLMDIFVLPSHREGMPLSVMEAQAMGLPIITTDARGCLESIVPGRTGIIVPAQSAEALAGAILFLASNAEVRHRMGEAGRQLAKERFNQELAFETLEQEYSRLLRVRKLALPSSRPAQ